MERGAVPPLAGGHMMPASRQGPVVVRSSVPRLSLPCHTFVTVQLLPASAGAFSAIRVGGGAAGLAVATTGTMTCVTWLVLRPSEPQRFITLARTTSAVTARPSCILLV